MGGPTSVALRAASADDVDAVSTIWSRGWRDGHLGNVPQALIRARTEASFSTRAQERVGDTTVAVAGGDVAGFITVVGDEVEQVYVDTEHRGGGVAAALLAEAEHQVRSGGHATAWLAVVAGNAAARRFYAKHGWVDDGPFDYQTSGLDGPIIVPAHRYVKVVG